MFCPVTFLVIQHCIVVIHCHDSLLIVLLPDVRLACNMLGDVGRSVDDVIGVIGHAKLEESDLVPISQVGILVDVYFIVELKLILLPHKIRSSLSPLI